MSRKWTLCCAVLAVLPAVLAPPARAQSVADSARLAARTDSIFAAYDSLDEPGCALGVVRDGRLAYARGYGAAEIGWRIPIGPRTVFYIASTSKQFTAASIQLLVDRGRLSLNDDVRRWIPELPDLGHRVTVLELLNHTSGVRDYLALMQAAGIRFEDVHSVGEVLALLGRQRALNFEPGTEWLYSNSGYVLLAEIVHRVTGQSLREFASENLFGPLGMHHTGFRDDRHVIVPRRALAYDPAPGGGYRLDYLANFELVGDGGLLTTVDDLARWDGEFYSGQVGGLRLPHELETRAVLANGDTLPYARGLFIGHYRGLATVSHGGAMMGFRTELLRFPTERTSAIVLCNRSDANPTKLARRVADVWLAGELGPPEAEGDAARAGVSGAASDSASKAAPPVVTPAVLAAYAGDYYSPELDAAYAVSVDGDSLQAHVRNRFERDGRTYTLERDTTPVHLGPLEPDVFGRRGLKIHFERDRSGAVTGFTLDAGRILGIEFQRDTR